jgi:hypothetical protein
LHPVVGHRLPSPLDSATFAPREDYPSKCWVRAKVVRRIGVSFKPRHNAIWPATQDRVSGDVLGVASAAWLRRRAS